MTTNTATAPHTFVRSSDDAEATWFLNALMTTLATREETGGAFALMEHTLTSASNPPLHIQEVEDESFYVLDGTMEFDVDGETILAGPGTFAFVARGTAHSFRILSDVVRMLVIVSGDAPAGGLHSFFQAAGEPAQRRGLPTPAAPDPVVLNREATAHAITIVGPPA